MNNPRQSKTSSPMLKKLRESKGETNTDREPIIRAACGYKLVLTVAKWCYGLTLTSRCFHFCRELSGLPLSLLKIGMRSNPNNPVVVPPTGGFQEPCAVGVSKVM